MLLALGLNVVGRLGGLLDLGFVAFYGIAAYAYAILDRTSRIHLPTLRVGAADRRESGRSSASCSDCRPGASPAITSRS